MPSNQPTWEDIQRSLTDMQLREASNRRVAQYNNQVAPPSGTGQPTFSDKMQSIQEKLGGLADKHGIRILEKPTWEEVEKSGQMPRGDMPRENYAPPLGQGVPYNSPRRRRGDILEDNVNPGGQGFYIPQSGSQPTNNPFVTTPNTSNQPTLDPRGVLGPNYQERAPMRGGGNAAQWERFRSLMER
tara:strand:- start:636 stop:1193 length:558 start_codon:yes stop_codon:yes gene_type:complete